jgi:hypothetical protein
LQKNAFATWCPLFAAKLLPKKVPVELNVLGREPGLVDAILSRLKRGNKAGADLRRRIDLQIQFDALMS